ncbi:GNAT family N-acetyltransferase [Hephaestia mangrovi]|uniref:GNAT family N-acetyltransferase n=1 Tax=Hephaestia mangrovi TaxID=2873268 RepID=UPI001CA60FF5|nr:GNAT family N-acetyltransferase [Hephaestia mangrovi]MBY8829604.1 GNAT family N-acetyltransferase [Hephaestia mangrovi]
MKIREARAADAEAMSDVLVELALAGKRAQAGDAAFVRERYLDDPQRVRCSVATDGAGRVLGFQSLKVADEGNPYDTPLGWGIIGTHIRPSAARLGIGRALFVETLAAARGAGLKDIEAFIGMSNTEGQGYYEAMGFETWRETETAICKSFKIDRQSD